MKTIDKDTAKKYIYATNGKYFSAVFIKKDGEKRFIHCRIRVKKGVKGVDSSAKGAKSGLGGMSSAAKGLGTAFKALGIGLIIAAFMKLKDLFSGNIETARRFERISAQLSAAFDVLRDRAENFIK